MSVAGDFWLTVWVRDLPLALPLAQVREVLPWVPYQRGLSRGAGELGVLSLRGEDWPVWDLARFWGLKPRTPDLETHLVLMNRPDGRRFGAVLVDRVGWVIASPPNESLAGASLPGMPFRETVTDGESGSEHFVTTVVDLLDCPGVASEGA